MGKKTESTDFSNYRTIAIHNMVISDCKIHCCGYDTKANQYHPINHRVLFVEFRIEKEIVGLESNQQDQSRQQFSSRATCIRAEIGVAGGKPKHVGAEQDVQQDDDNGARLFFHNQKC